MDTSAEPVAVITPTCHRHEPLLKAIRSVQAQTHPTWHQYIVGDGYDSATERIVADLQCPHLTLAFTPRTKNWGNQQRHYALTRLLRSERFVVFLDDDNVLNPDYMQTMLSAILEVKAAWGICLVDSTARGIGVVGHKVAINRIDTLCIMVDAKIARHVGWTSRVYAGDWEFISAFQRQSGVGPPAVVDRVLGRRG